MTISRMQEGIEMHALGDTAEAQAHDVDVESLQPLSRDSSWTRSWKGNRIGTSLSAASIGSTVSHWSISWVARWSPSNRTIPETLSMESLTEMQTKFIIAILGEMPREKLLTEACSWYLNFLEFKIREAWATLFSPVLKSSVATPPCDEDISLAYKILLIVVGTLSRDDLALTDIVDKLYNADILRETDDERSCANQLVLAALGWISCLYSARHNPDPDKLQIIPPGPSSTTSSIQIEPPRRSRISRRGGVKKTFRNFSQTLENNAQPLHHLLGRFGNVIPQQQRTWELSGHQSPSSFAPARKNNNDPIKLALLCYYTLTKIANIKIEWVDSLSLHLEFDSATKTLKLFRMPSLCLLMCCGETPSPMSKLFSDASESYHHGLPPSSTDDASDFNREVLLSFRLLFGQDSASYSSFTTLLEKSPLPLDHQDPMLAVLCVGSSESAGAQAIYEMIEADEASTQYTAATHFPFLGERLLDLQRHVEAQNPSTFSSLWHDKRNTLIWWNLWPVLFFGVITLVLTVLFGFSQTVLGGYQVYYARLQVSLQQGVTA